ncbi:hypothetical protein BKP43_33570 [Variovorax boronicumulans]|nr:hypothetical protein BKP43_33570 [Variovorax boronicumulans]
MRRKRALAYVLTAVLLAGCANARGPTFRPAENIKPEDGVVYVYREEAFASGARSAYFYVDGVNVFNLDTGGYSWAALPPGSHKLRLEWAWDMLKKPVEMDISIRAGEAKYVALKTNTCMVPGNVTCLDVGLRETSAAIASQEIRSMAFQENFGLERLKARKP